MVIFNFEEAGDWNRACCHSNIKMWTFSLLVEIFLILCHTTVLAHTDIISDQICIIGKLEYLWNKKRYYKKTPFYSTLKSLLNECIFKMTYFSGHMHFKARSPPASLPIKGQVTEQTAVTYSIPTRLFQIPHFFELKTISLGFALHSFAIGYDFDLPLFWTHFRFLVSSK